MYKIIIRTIDELGFFVKSYLTFYKITKATFCKNLRSQNYQQIKLWRYDVYEN
jgi:hypothetical protein